MDKPRAHAVITVAAILEAYTYIKGVMSRNSIESTFLFLPVEIKARELHGKVLLALAAAEAGFKVVIGRQKELRYRLHKYPPGLYRAKSVAV